MSVIPRQGTATFNERRNTSRVFAPDANALPDALRALAQLRRTDPYLVHWIEDGYPTLTAAEHRKRFGHDHPGRKRR